MKLAWLIPAVLCGLVVFHGTLNDVAPPVAVAPAAPPASAELSAADRPDVLPFSPGQLGASPLGVLFDINTGGSVETTQAMGMLPPGWKKETPYNLDGPMPADAEVRAAIVKGVEYILSLQNENGSWDVVLTGDLLSETADQAVDAIAITSLAGYALRRHIKVDPERISKALERAFRFVADRIYRGKLPMYVQYANWRYTMGLKFLHQEYLHATTEETRSEIRSVARRLVQGLLRLQRSNSAAPELDRKRRARISGRKLETARPASLGVVLAPPTDTDYRGGALVTAVRPGSTADKNGIKPTDRIYECEGVRVENALDYYMLEAEFLGGQKINVGVRREGAKDWKKDMTLDQTWPGYLGLQVNAGMGDGPVVEGFLPFSPAKGVLEVGDIITEADGVALTEIAQLREIEGKVKPGDKVKLKLLRGEKKKKVSESLEAAGAPEGWFYFGVAEEDKGDEDGVVVAGDPNPATPAGQAGLKDEDRITWIGDVPILGRDHLLYFVGTIAAGKPYTVKWIRGSEEMQAEMIARPIPQPFDPGFDIDMNGRLQVYLTSITKGGAAEKAGMKQGDIFMKINGQDASNLFVFRPLYFGLSAGEEVTFTMLRSGKELDFTFELPKQTITEGGDEDAEEGGWLYYPQMAEAPSFCTAAAMLALMDAEKDLGIKGLGKVLKQPLRAAANLINSHRVADKENGGLEMYVYYNASKASQPGMDVRGAQGRNSICELALVRMGLFKRSKSTLKKIIEQWVKYRGELDAHRNLILYAPPNKRGSPHNYDSQFNAAYYWMYGHYHTLLAAKECGGKTFTDLNQLCVKAVMADREEDGTWLEHHSFGKLCGTSLALWILGESEGPWRDGYGDPTTQDKKTNPETPDK